MKTMSDQQSAGASIFGTITTLGFYTLSQLGIGQWATVVAIIAGLSTIAVNIQRFLINRKNRK